jgi:hypothetical protein
MHSFTYKDYPNHQISLFYNVMEKSSTLKKHKLKKCKQGIVTSVEHKTKQEISLPYMHDRDEVFHLWVTIYSHIYTHHLLWAVHLRATATIHKGSFKNN